ncbi:phosphoadenylyl-sulfate reductase [Pseudokineococcus lusitanus]|uniref:Adenosine 5'-phosphosulfate reductase n=1 Tax=Pseudokineococcus lusitanus TaxID=763993 RepID=A0A3N1GAR4_9ACTN|nr:phosphoadenylyl-sulfate reductase [Pseudokineococcus lusitanus]ROP27322.1 phosphoadenylylsulfate reductase (thioredoxin) [Pseudokineococcus lusitanus]
MTAVEHVHPGLAAGVAAAGLGVPRVRPPGATPRPVPSDRLARTEQPRADVPRRRTRSEAELRELAAEGQRRFGDAEGVEGALAVLRWVSEELGDGVAVASSMANAVLPHLAARARPGVDVLFLETGYHFPETLRTRDDVRASMDVTVVDVTAPLTVAEQDARYGARLHDRDPGLCCAMRKVEPLRAQLAGYDAWVTGVRREETSTRTGAPVVSFDEKHGLVKVNPIAGWSWDDLVGYAEEHGVLLNPLLLDGFPSIGCAPCTARVAPGADPRSGRWAGLGKTECGIHT